MNKFGSKHLLLHAPNRAIFISNNSRQEIKSKMRNILYVGYGQVVLLVAAFLAFSGCEHSVQESNIPSRVSSETGAFHGVFQTADGRSEAVVSGKRLVINGILRNGDEFSFGGQFYQNGDSFQADGTFITLFGKKSFTLRGRCQGDVLYVENDNLTFVRKN